MSREHARSQGRPSIDRAARLARFTSGGVWTSLLDVPGAVTATSLGLPPIGEVMGAVVQRMDRLGYDGCGWVRPSTVDYYSGREDVPTTRSNPRSMFGTRRVQGRMVEKCYEIALERLTAEARALRAHGVVGVRLTMESVQKDVHRFVALGTAVRWPGRTPLREPFVTDLPAPDVAKLLASGWAPAAIAYGISIGVRHDDQATRLQSSRLNLPNTEVSGYTELLQRVRADARDRFGAHVGQIGADGALVSSCTLRAWVVRPGDTPGHRDHAAEAAVFGTAIVRFRTGPPAPPRALTVLPLHSRRTEPSPGARRH